MATDTRRANTLARRPGSARPDSQRRFARRRARAFAAAANAVALPFGCFFHLGCFFDLLLLCSNQRLILLFDGDRMGYEVIQINLPHDKYEVSKSKMALERMRSAVESGDLTSFWLVAACDEIRVARLFWPLFKREWERKGAEGGIALGVLKDYGTTVRFRCLKRLHK